MTNLISPSQYLVGKIRLGYASGDLVDYNSAQRVGTNFAFSDFPRILDLLKSKNNFPRISVEIMDASTIKRMGLQCTDHHDLVQLAINIWAPENLICEISNTPTENHTYITGTTVYELDNIPVSIIGATIDGTKDGGVYSFTRGTDYELIDVDYDGFYDSVSWIGDVPDDGTTFTCAYNRKAGGAELVRIIAADVNEYIRKNWLSWFALDNKLTYYKVLSNKPIEIEENINRYELFVTFKGINL